MSVIGDILSTFANGVADIISGLFQFLIDFIVYIGNFLLLPIDAVINSAIPNYADVTSFINDALVTSSQYLGYCIDSLGIYHSTLVVLVGVFIFKITLPLHFWVIKLAIRWFKALKI